MAPKKAEALNGKVTRRNFLKTAAIGGAAAVAAPAFAKIPKAAAESPGTAPLDYSGDAEVPIPIAPKTYPGTTVQVETGAEALYELLRGIGVDYIFASPGDEWAPLWDSVSKNIARGTEKPVYIQTLDELHSVSMAAGYTTYTGRPQVCIFHNIIGGMNAALGIKTANYAGIPLVLMGAMDTLFESEVSYAETESKLGFQENHMGNLIQVPYYVKWDYEAHTNINLPQVIGRAFQIAKTPPMGCSNIFIPTELLGETVSSVSVPPQSRWSAPAPADINSANLTAAAKLLAGASNPMVLTANVGINPNVPPLLVQFAEKYGMPIFAGTAYVDYPTTHPLYISGSASYIGQADVVLSLQGGPPGGAVSTTSLPETTKVIYMGSDPVYDRYPYPATDRYDPNFVFRVDPMNGLTALSTALDSQTAISPSTVGNRIATWTSVHNQQSAANTTALNSLSNSYPIDKAWVAYNLGQVITPDTILVTELITPGGSVSSYIPRTNPGTKFPSLAPQQGALGGGIGTAQGIKFAAPNKQVVVAIGDGCFNYNPVLAGLWTSWQYNLPIMIVIFDNGAYEDMAYRQLLAEPNGWGVQTQNFPGGKLDRYHYAKLADLFDFYGDTITNPATVNSQLTEAFEAVQNGTTAIIDAQIALTYKVTVPEKTLLPIP